MHYKLYSRLQNAKATMFIVPSKSIFHRDISKIIKTFPIFRKRQGHGKGGFNGERTE